jgi:endonuclease/exonuclease/phosphatase family metal-dependent hydrolase
MKHLPTASTLLLALAAAAAAGADTVPLRLVTLNVKEGLGAPSDPSHQATGDFVTTNDVDGAGPNSGLSPDIVAFQECRSDTNLQAFREAYLPGFTYHRLAQVDAGGNFQCLFVRGDIQVLDVDSYYIGGPRNLLRVTMQVPGVDGVVTVYNGHFKAFGDASSVAQRRANADNTGIAVFTDIGASIVIGDLNSNNNIDTTLNGLFTHAIQGVPTGVLNLAVETLGGQNAGGAPILATFPSSNSRLDYICLNNATASVFDVDGTPGFSQTELNSMGFVYYSGDDAGRMSNGDASATSFATDHRPVVFNIQLPSLAQPCVGDLDGDLVISFSDLNILLGNYNQVGVGLDGDLDDDGDVDFADLNTLLGLYNSAC